MPTGKPTKSKPCKICNELFIPDTPSQKICHKDHVVQCPICGKDIVWNSTSAIVPCSKECRRIKTKQDNIEKYGVAHPMKLKSVQDKHKATMLDKYGVESPLQSEELKQKAKDTNRQKFGSDWALSNETVRTKSRNTMINKYGAKTTLESQELKCKVHDTVVKKYGNDNPMQSEEIKNKVRATNISKYGVDNPMKCQRISNKVSSTRNIKLQTDWKDLVLSKCQSTWIENLGVDNPSKSPVILDKITSTFMKKYGVKRAVNVPEFRQKMIDTMIDRYGVPYYIQSENASLHTGKIPIINKKKFAERLDSLNIPYQMEFPIESKSYDFRILNTNILIEIDPTYTHNIIGNHWNRNGISNNYHLNKTQIAEDNGYRCIHVFDWDDIDKIVDLINPNIQSIYARNTQVYVLNRKTTNDFLNKYHIQRSCKGQTLCLGLVYQDELVEVMTFGRSRYDKIHDVELLRLCTHSRYRVIGGASKLFKYATKYYGLSNIISYCDLSKFTGNVYSQLGMKLIRKSPPQEIWSKGNQKITANLLRQRGYDQLFNTNYGKGTSNDQLMIENGWLPVFDCGQSVYEWK
jgi:endogenous inhibitor of DNA gyrase (YacG/DUF329 family)